MNSGMRDAGGGAPAGATASESDDSNIAKIAHGAPRKGVESSDSSTSGPEATSSQGNPSNDERLCGACGRPIPSGGSIHCGTEHAPLATEEFCTWENCICDKEHRTVRGDLLPTDEAKSSKDRLDLIRQTLSDLEKHGHNCDWGREADLKWCVGEIERLRADRDRWKKRADELFFAEPGEERPAVETPASLSSTATETIAENLREMAGFRYKGWSDDARLWMLRAASALAGPVTAEKTTCICGMPDPLPQGAAHFSGCPKSPLYEAEDETSCNHDHGSPHHTLNIHRQDAGGRVKKLLVRCRLCPYEQDLLASLAFEDKGRAWCRYCQVPDGRHRGGCPAEAGEPEIVGFSVKDGNVVRAASGPYTPPPDGDYVLKRAGKTTGVGPAHVFADADNNGRNARVLISPKAGSINDKAAGDRTEKTDVSQIANLKGLVKRLREGIDKYGYHLTLCPANGELGPCECGWNDFDESAAMHNDRLPDTEAPDHAENGSCEPTK